MQKDTDVAKAVASWWDQRSKSCSGARSDQIGKNAC